MNEKAPVRILAVDGGGIRGIVPSRVLIALQQRLARPLVEYFDVVAGTSTGGLVAAALCAPDAAGAPRYTPATILDFYRRDCDRIFQRSELWKLESLDGMRRPKYPAEGVESFLADRFGDLQLKDALRPLVLVSYDLGRRAPWVFSSVLAGQDPARNFYVRDACRATTAAPTYFPAAIVRSLAGDSRALVDGGVCANDPSLAAFVVADRLFPGRPVQIVSLGTGNLTTPIDGHEAQHWGVTGWAWHVLEVLADGQSSMSEAALQRLVGSTARDGSSYRRLQPQLPAGLGRLDDTSAANIAGLQEVTSLYCEEQAALLDRLAASLTR